MTNLFYDKKNRGGERRLSSVPYFSAIYLTFNLKKAILKNQFAECAVRQYSTLLNYNIKESHFQQVVFFLLTLESER